MIDLSLFGWLWRSGRAAVPLAACLFPIGCDLGVAGNGERAEEVREQSPFSRVRNDSELDVQIRQGETQQLLLSLDSNLLDYVETRVDDGTLFISTSDDVAELVSGPHVRITVPELTAAKLAGSGELRVSMDQPALPLDLYSSGSGDVRFEGRTAALGAFLTGSGDLRLKGETSDVELAVTGSGDIDAKDLSALSATVGLSGSGDVSVRASESVRVALTGSGDIDVYGGPALEIVDESGSGDLDRH